MISLGPLSLLLFNVILFTPHVTIGTKLKFEIKTTWDNLTIIDHAPVEVSLKSTECQMLEIAVKAPFFDKPSAPPGPPGPFWQLWNYEVVEAFFLGEENRYLELQFNPHGQYLVLMLNGIRNIVAECLPLKFSSTISRRTSTWQGRALVPRSYFPPNVTKFNAYAIHGSDPDRVYESLYPSPSGKFTDPDFHRLQYFQPIDFDALFPNKPVDGLPPIWQDVLDGKLNYTCTGK